MDEDVLVKEVLAFTLTLGIFTTGFKKKCRQKLLIARPSPHVGGKIAGARGKSLLKSWDTTFLPY